jgi:hypothetical protein
LDAFFVRNPLPALINYQKEGFSVVFSGAAYTTNRCLLIKRWAIWFLKFRPDLDKNELGKAIESYQVGMP